MYKEYQYVPEAIRLAQILELVIDKARESRIYMYNTNAESSY